MADRIRVTSLMCSSITAAGITGQRRGREPTGGDRVPGQEHSARGRLPIPLGGQRSGGRGSGRAALISPLPSWERGRGGGGGDGSAGASPSQPGVSPEQPSGSAVALSEAWGF